ncbi:MAG: hypothetical protein HQL81_09245 [Magnetococcales bacterium]|nr:hypothetical protein [Magnetococcales bacterium]MBF0631166.1 hypothetical protein [Magnetococcales bacterium]
MTDLLKKSIMMVLIVPLWTFISGCGSGGGGGGADSSGTTSKISGTVIDGPVIGARVALVNSNGKSLIAIKTGTDATYSISVPDGTTYPLRVSVTGGTDKVTEEAPAAMDSLIQDASQTTANVTPMTTLIYQAVIAKAGNLDQMTSTMLADAKKNVITQFGFGIDAESSTIDPIATPVDSGNVSSMVRSSEALAETARRAVGSDQTTVAQVLTLMGEDLADGYIDGKKNGADLANTLPSGFTATTIASAVAQQKVAVGLEVLANDMTVTKSDGTELSAATTRTLLSEGVNRIVPTLSSSAALSKMDQMPLSRNQWTQMMTDLGNVIKIQSTLGESTSTLSALESEARNLQPGQPSTGKLNTTLTSNAISGVDTITSNLKTSQFATTLISSAAAAVGPPGSFTISGAILDGPVIGAIITIKDSTDTTILGTTTSGADARYVMTLPSGASFPLHVSSSGGTNQISGETAASMDSYVIDANQTTANLSPITSVMYHAARSAAGRLVSVTATIAALIKTGIIDEFGFGIDAQDSTFDPITSPIRSGNVASVVRASPALAETIRRAAGPETTTVSQSFAMLGEDMADGTLNGTNNGATILSTAPTGFNITSLITAIMQHKAIVAVEVANNSLKTTYRDGTQISASDVLTALSKAVNTLVPSVTTSNATTTMAALLVSTRQNLQITEDITEALKEQSTRGVSTTNLTALQTAAASLQSAQTGAGVVSTSVIDAAAVTATSLTNSIRNGT